MISWIFPYFANPLSIQLYTPFPEGSNEHREKKSSQMFHFHLSFSL